MPWIMRHVSCVMAHAYVMNVMRYAYSCAYVHTLQNGIIFVAYTSTSSSTPLAFLFTHTAHDTTSHVWLCACASTSQRQGIMSTLWTHAETHARACKHVYMRVRTVPMRYGAMVCLLEGRGYSTSDTGVKCTYIKVCSTGRPCVCVCVYICVM